MKTYSCENCVNYKKDKTCKKTKNFSVNQITRMINNIEYDHNGKIISVDCDYYKEKEHEK